MEFELEKKLENESILVTNYKDIQIRLANDSRFFWVILVPICVKKNRKVILYEIHDLPETMATDLWELIIHLSKSIKEYTKADKINIGALGNVVRQLHIHVVARHQTDQAWPDPIWGNGKMEKLSKKERNSRLLVIQDLTRKFLGTM